MGKKVISVDLNPLSFTAMASDVTIDDNIMRAIPNMIKISEQLVKRDKSYLLQQIKNFDNKENMHSNVAIDKKRNLKWEVKKSKLTISEILNKKKTKKNNNVNITIIPYLVFVMRLIWIWS